MGTDFLKNYFSSTMIFSALFLLNTEVVGSGRFEGHFCAKAGRSRM